MVNEYAVVSGSLGAVARQGGVSLAESFVGATAIVLCDVSGSMAAKDSRGGLSRYDVLLQELGQLQSNLPGKLAILAFSDSCIFVPGGEPPFMGSGTDLAAALRFAKVADGVGATFLVISDGCPDDQQEALDVARTFKSRIDSIFVGPENNRESGREFLARLATASGGKTLVADRLKELGAKAQQLLLN